MKRTIVAIALVVGCERGAPAPAGNASAAPPVPVPSAKPPNAASLPQTPEVSAACRAITARGAARTRGGMPLAAQSPLDGARWVELEAGAEIAVRHGRSAREWILKGPLAALPCRDGVEELLVGAGTLRSVPGTGVRPGAEVLIATPFGAVRYGDADVELVVERDRLRIAVLRGDVWVDAARGVTGLPADGRVRTGARVQTRKRPDVSTLVRECEALAAEAESGARAVLSGSAGSLGGGARAQLGQRRSARSACGIAGAALDVVESEEIRSRLGDQIRAAERRWRAIPSAAPAPSP